MRMCALLMLAAALPLCQFAKIDIERRTATNEPATALARFVDYAANGRKGNFVLNPRFWLKDVDFSCVSPWNDGGGRMRGGTAISRRHVIFARHYPLWSGVRMVFVGEDGGVCPARITATKGVEGTDIMIGLLDYELTPNIRPAKILPSGYEKYIGDGYDLPVVTFTQDERVLLFALGYLKRKDTGKPIDAIGSHFPGSPTQLRFNEKIITGDSGNPAFLLFGREPVLAYCLHGGCGGNGPAIHFYRREIQATMDALSPGYKLEEFDFAALERK